MSRSTPTLMFREAQSIRHPRIRLVLAILPLMFTGLLIWQVGMGHEPPAGGLSNNEIIGWTMVLWLIYLRLVSVRLLTRVNSSAVLISLQGLWTLQKIRLADIRSAEVVTYNAKTDYRGYGIRSNGRNRAYIADGDRGVLITPIEGDPVLIGSQRVLEFYRSLFR